jgi:hypothetical protein
MVYQQRCVNRIPEPEYERIVAPDNDFSETQNLQQEAQTRCEKEIIEGPSCPATIERKNEWGVYEEPGAHPAKAPHRLHTTLNDSL